MQSMTVEPNEEVLCPKCQSCITVDAAWRLVQCPHCGEMVSRMTDDSSYD
jgi:predicted RNA-binding Zn-ribbon protein involved in translation (DUF1610 family)